VHICNISGSRKKENEVVAGKKVEIYIYFGEKGKREKWQ
jgi:hypothetical protein